MACLYMFAWEQNASWINNVLGAGLPVDCWSLGVIIYILLGGYPPFHDEDQKRLYKKIRKGVYEFHAEYWGNVSEDAKDLIRGFLTVNPLDRLTVDQALKHPWLQSDEEKLAERGLGNNLVELRRFNARRKFRRGVRAVMAVNRMRFLLGSLGKLKESIALEEAAIEEKELYAAKQGVGAVLKESGSASGGEGSGPSKQKEDDLRDATTTATATSAAEPTGGLKDNTRI